MPPFIVPRAVLLVPRVHGKGGHKNDQIGVRGAKLKEAVVEGKIGYNSLWEKYPEEKLMKNFQGVIFL